MAAASTSAPGAMFRSGLVRHLIQDGSSELRPTLWPQVAWREYCHSPWDPTKGSPTSRLGTGTNYRISGSIRLEAKWKRKSLSRVQLCNPMDYTVHGILQARILEWVAFPFSRGFSQSRGGTQVSHIAGRFFTSLSHKGSPRIQGWVALPFSRGSSQPRDQTPVFHNAGRFFTNWVTLEAKCTINVMHLNHPETVSPLPSPMFLETLSSMKLVPGAKKVGNPWRSSPTHHLQESTCSRGSTHLPILCAENNTCPCFWTQIDLFLLAPKNLSRRTFMEVWLERVLVVIFTLESQRQIKILFNFLKTFTKLAYT